MSSIADLLAGWLPEQRWYSGKGRALSTVDTTVVPLSTQPPVDLHQVRVGYADGGSDVFLVPISRRIEQHEHLASALIGTSDDGATWLYDAMRDRDVTPIWLDLFAEGHHADGISFHPEPGAQIPQGMPGDIISTEQSNSSLIFGESAIMKLFRRLEPGLNPDVEIHDALHSTNNPHVAPLLGYVSISQPAGSQFAEPGADVGTVAMLQEFLTSASDGWSLAVASVRDLYAEGDLHPEEVGGDFAGESYRLGEATASVHADLAAVLPTATVRSQNLRAVVTGMAGRLDAAILVVPELQQHAAALRRCFEAIATLPGPVPVQRVHGDFHLGQVLRTYTGWTILDFEGEPARPLAERRGLQSPLRDVAGMLRSFDYAARHLLVEGPADPQLDYRAHEWAARNRQAFCDGYAHGGGAEPAEHTVLLRAFEVEKAVYEAVYEVRNRPHWLPIPLSSLARLAAVGDA